MFYRVADLGLMGFLYISGFRHQEVEVDGNRCIFLFPDSHEIRDAQKAYEDGTASVDPQRYYKALRTIRNLTADIKRHDQLSA